MPSCATDSWQGSLGARVHDKGTHWNHLQSCRQRQALGFCNKQKLVNQLSRGFPEDVESTERHVQLGQGYSNMATAMVFPSRISGNWLLPRCQADLMDMM